MTLKISRLPSFAAAQPAWALLVAADAHASFFARPEWLETWWRHHSGGKELLLVLGEASGRPVALAPLQLESLRGGMGHRVAFLGSGLSDYGDLLVDETQTDRAAAVTAILDAVAGWYPAAVFDFEQISEASPTLDVLREWTRARGLQTVTIPQDICPIAALPAEPELYHKQLKKSFFLDLKRGERRLRERGAVALIDHMRPTDGDWTDLVTAMGGLQTQRMLSKGETPMWQGPLGLFVRDVLQATDAEGSLRVTGLTFDGRLIAYELCFLHKNVIYAWSRAFDEDFRNTGPGKIALLHLLDQGIEQGYRRFDLLRGEEPYKAFWTNGQTQTYRTTFVIKPSFAAWLWFKYVTAWKQQLRELPVARKAYQALKAMRGGGR
ncbi:MAG: Protein involved in cellulose biosynthesis (CelD)-like [Firmicutes bacterium]|nr:Protein involved in cellulose biosynthesis (CelD)-like [Bacillota bacterium]